MEAPAEQASVQGALRARFTLHTAAHQEPWLTVQASTTQHLHRRASCMPGRGACELAMMETGHAFGSSWASSNVL
eukprot:CAMPEP_0175399794 /NCGR_PEP_ID=MMETSP0095-20121207/36174_1 /TAXON_ID=311494 /ORGANISM="Alexandrium monilatum, Strain CCMP3105" /LENGTH=74 /DNA_ID=CAMNT_0016698519 /DNA_START=35 /DNA_END=256 /DNA_ORIENTATION=-